MHGTQSECFFSALHLCISSLTTITARGRRNRIFLTEFFSSTKWKSYFLKSFMGLRFPFHGAPHGSFSTLESTRFFSTIASITVRDLTRPSFFAPTAFFVFFVFFLSCPRLNCTNHRVREPCCVLNYQISINVQNLWGFLQTNLSNKQLQQQM